MSMLQSLKKKMFSIDYNAKDPLLSRGFHHAGEDLHEVLEKIVHILMDGYNLAVKVPDPYEVSRIIEKKYDAHYLGFAFEGASMYYAILDLLLPWGKSRLRRFIEEVLPQHSYLLGSGAGYAMGRIPWGPLLMDRYRKKFNPLPAISMPSGYGLHLAIFKMESYVIKCKAPPARFNEYDKRLFDSGVGRALWWIGGTDPVVITGHINRFPEDRKAELWLGVGQAGSYSGIVSDETMHKLLELSGDYRYDFLSGTPFSTNIRRVSMNKCEWTSHVCELLLGTNDEVASEMVQNIIDKITTEFAGKDQTKIGRVYVMIREELKKSLKDMRI